MGDRANVYIHEGEDPGVYIYTHWAGTELPQKVKEALSTERAGSRFYDAPYLTRILIEELTADDRDSATGWGVSATVGDGDDRIVDIKVAGNSPEITLRGYPYTWENMPSDPFNVCDECGQSLP